ncbi:MAG TPA: hypothetical protein VHK69_11875, partial [Chitinophagaceae bacterium]|nr:hypothetical protein [Chitinophagaceae bacterium]
MNAKVYGKNKGMRFCYSFLLIGLIVIFNLLFPWISALASFFFVNDHRISFHTLQVRALLVQYTVFLLPLSKSRKIKAPRRSSEAKKALP